MTTIRVPRVMDDGYLCGLFLGRADRQAGKDRRIAPDYVKEWAFHESFRAGYTAAYDGDEKEIAGKRLGLADIEEESQ